MADRLFLFVHIEKCGGTTLVEMLRRNFVLRHVDIIPLDRSADYVEERDLDSALRKQPWARSFAGHSIRPYCDFGRRTPQLNFYTLLRDPVSRAYSDYLHDCTRRGFTGSIADWLQYDDRHDFQVKALSANGDFAEAIQILDQRIGLFGLVEEFDDFLVRFNRYVAPHPFPLHYERLNQAMLTRGRKRGQSPSRPKLSDADRERFVAANQLDQQLYDWAKIRLAARFQDDKAPKPVMQSAGFGDRLRVMLNRFQRNFWYKPWLGYWPTSLHALPRNAVDSQTFHLSRDR